MTRYETSKKLAEVVINKGADWNDEVIIALIKAGFVVMLDYDGTTEKRYIVGKEMEVVNK